MKAVIYNQSGWLYGDLPLTFLIDLELMLQGSGFTVLNHIDHRFSPIGYTKLWLLGESHFAFHSFPEEQVSYIELSSCVEDKALLFWVALKDWLQRSQMWATIKPVSVLTPIK